MFRIDLVLIGNVDRGIVQFLADATSENLGMPCRVRHGRLDVSAAFHAGRQQYNSTQLLGQLTELDCEPDTKLLGVADVDLFIPILTFVFGEAQLRNRAAVMSVYRLRQSFYGLPDDQSLFYERCEKEAVHELGHAFGLIHCRNFECVMHYSNSIEQVDLKSPTFCAECARLLGPLRATNQRAAAVKPTVPVKLFGLEEARS